MKADSLDFPPLGLADPSQPSDPARPFAIPAFIPWLFLGIFALCLVLLRPSRLGFPEMVLGSGFLLVAGLASYLFHAHLRSVAARHFERELARSEFESVLVQALRPPRSARFDFAVLAHSSGVSLSDAALVADKLLARLASRVVADGVITPHERAKLDGLARLLLVPDHRAASILAGAKASHYRDAVSDVLADGVVTDAEAARLGALRSSLDIAEKDGLAIGGDMVKDSYYRAVRKVVELGFFDESSYGQLVVLKRGLGLRDVDSIRLLGDASSALYSQAFATVIADGIVTPAEEQLLDWLRRETRLSDAEYLPFAARLSQMKAIAACRSGQLPVVPTRKLLEGGELCHWDSLCTFTYQTQTRTISCPGELVVTSKRLFFNSPTKNLSFQPWKIISLHWDRSAVRIAVDARSGTGTYHAGSAELLNAVLTGLVKNTKYTSGSTRTASHSRHILPEVKRTVWHRDGGRCVDCGATGRGACLEFDHIIPHALGGSNEVANIQLLCRPCNQKKSDRI